MGLDMSALHFADPMVPNGADSVNSSPGLIIAVIGLGITKEHEAVRQASQSGSCCLDG